MLAAADRSRVPKNRSIFLFALIAVLLVLASTLELESVPPVWWDEGWTMMVARNWVERGQYGQLLEGELKPPGLSADFTVVAPVALSFRLLGIGIWQGRLPGTIFNLGALLWITLLADHLYNRKVAWLTLILVILLPANEKLNPILLGRQVLGEMPAMHYLLLGYLLLYFTLRGKLIWLVPAVLMWGLALRTKAQVPPFWLGSILLPLLYCLVRQSWRQAAILAITAGGAWLAALGIVWFQAWLLEGKTLSSTGLQGYYSMSVIVPVLHVRAWALISGITFGMSVLVGLLYACGQAWKNLRRVELDEPVEIVRLALLGLACSWMAWYLLMAMYWPRFLFPALFVGCIFAAKALHDLTCGLDLPGTIRKASSVFLSRATTPSALGALLAVVLTAWYLTVSGMIFSISYPTYSSTAAAQTAFYLNTETETDALIESYESQVQFLTQRSWHYPPDQVHVQLNKRSLIDPKTPVEYDALVADPDYLVVGPSGGEWQLYEPVLGAGNFTVLKEFPPYTIYARVRK